MTIIRYSRAQRRAIEAIKATQKRSFTEPQLKHLMISRATVRSLINLGVLIEMVSEDGYWYALSNRFCADRNVLGTPYTCPTCHGTMKIDGTNCTVCDGGEIDDSLIWSPYNFEDNDLTEEQS